MDDRGLAHLVHQAVGGIEGRRCRLGDVGDALAAHIAPALGIQRPDIDATQHHLAVLNVHASSGITHASQTDGGFAGAAFANQAEHFATLQVQVNPVNNHMAGHADQAQASDVQNGAVVHARRSFLEFSLGARGPGVDGQHPVDHQID